MDSPFSSQQLSALKKAKAALSAVVKLCDQGEAAGWDCEELRRELDFHRDRIDRISKTFFPDKQT